MRAFKKYFVFLVIFLGLSVQCLATQDLTLAYNQSQISDNYYVQPGGLYVSPNGLFVMLNGHLVQVSMIEADGRGIFVPWSEMSRQFVQCPFCRGWYDPEHPENHKCRGSPD